MVRQLVQPLGWGATLPHGPPNHPDRIGAVGPPSSEAGIVGVVCSSAVCVATKNNNKNSNTPPESGKTGDFEKGGGTDRVTGGGDRGGGFWWDGKTQNTPKNPAAGDSCGPPGKAMEVVAVDSNSTA